MSTLRFELRHRTAEECRDLWTGTATGGSSTTLLDTERWEPDHHWEGAELYIYASTGYDQTRRVIDSTQSGGVLTVVTAFSPAPAAGSSYELHTRFTVAQYNRALNRAIDAVKHLVLTDVVDETLLTSQDDWEYTIPSTFDFLREVWWEPTTSGSHDWQRLDYGAGDWDLAPGRLLRITRPADDVRLRLLGQSAWPELTADNSTVTRYEEYLVFRAAANLLGRNLTSNANDAPGWRDQLTYFEGRAKDLEPRKRVRPNGLRVT